MSKNITIKKCLWCESTDNLTTIETDGQIICAECLENSPDNFIDPTPW